VKNACNVIAISAFGLGPSDRAALDKVVRAM
jgi:hypothetical protein